MCETKHPLYNRCARSGCPSWLSFIIVNVQAYASWLPEIKLYENLTCVPHAACSYDVKLQHQEYTEQHVTDKKDSIQLTSVRLACARPIKNEGHGHEMLFVSFSWPANPDKNTGWNVQSILTYYSGRS